MRITFHLLSSSSVLFQILKLLIRMTQLLMGREEYDKFLCFSYFVQSTILGVICSESLGLSLFQLQIVGG